jgi:hypothetical protein
LRTSPLSRQNGLITSGYPDRGPTQLQGFATGGTSESWEHWNQSPPPTGINEVTVNLRDRQQSEDIRNLSEVNKMTNDFKEYQEKCRKHVHRMPDGRLPRRVFNYRPRGKWDLGRPRMRWFEQFMLPRNGSNGPKPSKEEEED